LLTDYKSQSRRPRRAAFRVLPWFAAGLGIPLISVGLMNNGPQSPAPGVEPATDAAQVAVDDELKAEAEIAAAESGEPDADPAQSQQSISAEAAPAGAELVLTVKAGDSLDRLFGRSDLSRADLAKIMDLDLGRQYLRLLRPGDQIQVRHDGPMLLSLHRDIGLTEALSISRNGDDFEARLIDRPLDIQIRQAIGTIDSSLFQAAADAGISDRTIMNLAGIFAWDVDFVLDIRSGDGFKLVYEELWRDGEKLGEGDILVAEFVNQGESFQAIRFETPDGHVDYYNPEGRSVRKAFVRAPLSFSRISSNFNPRRRHPKLNTIRAHKGVDYAAPTGTPVKAAGDGKVIFRGRQGGYGNTVVLQHGGNITTLYAHLSKFAKPRQGQRVRQGEVIGYVGATGLATGPHLHYEYRHNGTHMNPRTVKLPAAEPVAPQYMAEFQAAASSLLKQLDNAAPTVAAVASPQPAP
jgi:murein DD-endopeptidase MepM/ murein hydrolase activator NlpD